MSDQKIKVAIIGHGHLGKWHAQKINDSDDAELAAIVDTSESGQALAKKNYPSTFVTSDLGGIIEKIDAAFIVTPTVHHYEISKKLMQFGKHLFIEKPLAQTFQQAQDLINLNQDKDLIIQVGHSERFHRLWEKRELIQEVLADCGYLEIVRQAPFKGRATDVDVVADLMIHDIDLMLWFLGEVEFLNAQGLKTKSQNWDWVMAQFQAKNGARILLKVGRTATTEKRYLEALGKKGHIEIDLMTERFSFAPASTKTQEEIETKTFPKADHLQIEQEEFFQAIRSKTPPMVDINQGAKAVKVMDLVLNGLNRSDNVST